MEKDIPIVKLSISKPGNMTKRGRKRIANWLRKQATELEVEGDMYSFTGWFTARYFINKRKEKK